MYKCTNDKYILMYKIQFYNINNKIVNKNWATSLLCYVTTIYEKNL